MRNASRSETISVIAAVTMALELQGQSADIEIGCAELSLHCESWGWWPVSMGAD